MPDPLRIPGTARLTLRAGRRNVQLTSLHRPFFPEAGLLKRDLLQYYSDIAPMLLPPHPAATASTPVTWDEVERGIGIDDFTVANVPARVREIGELWRPLLYERGGFDLEAHL